MCERKCPSLWPSFGSLASSLFTEELIYLFNEKKCHFCENIFHHCHDTHLTLVHINADVSVHKLHCPQTDSELWMEVMATIAVTSVLSGKHPVEPWKQDVTQKKPSTSKPAYTVIRIYWSLLSQKRYMICWAFGFSPIPSIKHYSALSLGITWCGHECPNMWVHCCK